ncbi:DUF2500 domain-containing protein [Sporosarcina sp. G11-34]|uniref:DUF2500 domain-containing protein n=1 Tax=Sporosarcina sp. G11-34 TaxID=2849605 RepID=UPI0022A9895B|nr:DUF2500 domain-containing protein [Sporosarcina sp. G11-34]MCZ2258148.1 DUF2500 domain-containing protein [Sporosarcina sp. G11-34]
MYFDPDPLGNAMFTIVPILIIGVFIFIIIKGAAEWGSNNNAPKLTVPAKVVAKRTSTSGGTHHSSDNMHSTTTTSYYVTFQFESEDRSEFSLSGSKYGMLAEGDTGMLTFQGTRYLGFERVSDLFNEKELNS